MGRARSRKKGRTDARHLDRSGRNNRRRRKDIERASWYRGKRPILRFVFLFTVLFGLFFAVAQTDFFGRNVVAPNLDLNASVSGTILRYCGQDVRVDGRHISSSEATISIARGCDALYPTALFLTAIAVFPIAFRKKIIGAFVGTLVLLVVNVIRIFSLFLVQVHAPSLFEIMHVDVWQAIFVFLALFCWIVWLSWAIRTEKGPSRVCE